MPLPFVIPVWEIAVLRRIRLGPRIYEGAGKNL